MEETTTDTGHKNFDGFIVDLCPANLKDNIQGLLLSRKQTTGHTNDDGFIVNLYDTSVEGDIVGHHL